MSERRTEMNENREIIIDDTTYVYYITLEWSDYDFLNIPIVVVVGKMEKGELNKRVVGEGQRKVSRIIKLQDREFKELFVEQKGMRPWIRYRKWLEGAHISILTY
jgi:hypothetical protein